MRDSSSASSSTNRHLTAISPHYVGAAHYRGTCQSTIANPNIPHSITPRNSSKPGQILPFASPFSPTSSTSHSRPPVNHQCAETQAPPSITMAAMLEFRTQGYNPYAVKYSPYYDSRIAVATSANFGIVGNGRVFALGLTAQGIQVEKTYV